MPAIPVHSETRFEPFPLTDLQQAYWLGRTDAFALGGIASRAYLELEASNLDLNRLERAWNALIRRHDMLRVVVGDDGSQRVLPETPEYRIAIHDLRDHSAAEQVERLNERYERMLRDLRPASEWPLFDIQASLLSGGLVRLHVVQDVLNVDGGSMATLFQELAHLYRRPDEELPPLDLTFRDYVLHQRERETHPDFERAKRYWMERVADFPAAPDLPLATSPAALGAPEFRRLSTTLSVGVSERLRKLALDLGVSQTALFIAAYAEVLTAWSASARFTLNVPLFNRPPEHPGINSVVGPFTSVELLVIDNTSADGFAERARRVQRQLLSDLDHRRFDGVRVARELVRLRGAEGGSMPVVFTSLLDHRFSEAIGVLGRITRSINQTAQVWMDLHVDQVAGRFVLKWDAVEGLFPDGMVSDMLDALARVLEGAASGGAERTHAGVSMLPPSQAERRQSVNATAAAIPDLLAHQLIERQAKDRPNHPAVVSGVRRMTFGELDRLGNRIARTLRGNGVRPDELVAVVMDKGWEQIAAVVGILKAGAAYLPVDVESPSERLRYFLEHGDARVILTQKHLEQSIEWPSDRTRRCVDRDADWDTDETPIPAVQGADSLAYVLYTSGSTGAPKGAMIEHRSVVNRMTDVIARFGLGPDDRVIAITALHHDLSVFDIFGGLGAGATLVVPDHAQRRDPGHWTDLVAREGVTTWNSVPAFVEMLVEYVEERPVVERTRLGSLRRVIMSGDWIPVSLPDRIRRLAPDATVIGAGGPTETTVWDICYPIGDVDPSWKSIPYGAPMTNATYHVFDDSGEERPNWVPGELYIGGAGLARGFWRDAERTAEKFVHHPTTGERLYRSGDRGRWLPQGTIEIMGRTDFQVKIQGQRIELGEIESVLTRHPAVKNAVVAALGETGAKRRLVGYVVESNGAVADEDLRRFMAQQLPPHMIPTAWVHLERLPLSANGKVDRRALPNPEERRRPEARTPAAEPPNGGSDLEARLIGIVAAVLKLDAVDPDESLLSYGANSIDLVRLGNRLEQELGRRPRIDELFRVQTVRDLTHWYRERDPDLGAEPTPAAGEPRTEIERIIASYRVFLDPAERDEFKKTDPGIRHDLDASPALALPGTDESELASRYARRRAVRQFSLKPVPLAALSRMLECLRRVHMDGKTKHGYASAGAMYPNQLYLHAKPGRIQGLTAGTYYYHPDAHRLMLLEPHAEIDRSIHIPYINQPVYDEAGFSLFIVARLSAIAAAYGDRSWHFAVLEAGIMSHALELAASEAGIGLCHIGTVSFDEIRGRFRLDPSDVLVHSLVGGLPATGVDVGEAGGSSAHLFERIAELMPDEVQALLEAHRIADA
ncbi:MAG TPA: amino acid adenylation domain-containing protein [Gemmatimonadaceae bacterium]|nr:amino acid adenylation domain-containing protein [Gemmatimonadaceae bacterium]